VCVCGEIIISTDSTIFISRVTSYTVKIGEKYLKQ